MHEWIYICMYVYIYIYCKLKCTHTHTHIYIYTCIISMKLPLYIPLKRTSMYFPFPCLITGGQLDSFCCILGSLGLCCRLHIIGSISCWSFTLPVGICSESKKKKLLGVPQFWHLKIASFSDPPSIQSRTWWNRAEGERGGRGQGQLHPNDPKWLSDFTYFTSQAAKQPSNHEFCSCYPSLVGSVPHSLVGCPIFSMRLCAVHEFIIQPTSWWASVSSCHWWAPSKKTLKWRQELQAMGYLKDYALAPAPSVWGRHRASCGWDGKQWSPRSRRDSPEAASIDTWACLKIGYIPNYSHLIWIMISKTIGFRGLAYFQTNPHVNTLQGHKLMGKSDLMFCCCIFVGKKNVRHQFVGMQNTWVSVLNLNRQRPTWFIIL